MAGGYVYYGALIYGDGVFRPGGWRFLQYE